LFSDDTSVIVSNPNITDLEWNLNWVFKKWMNGATETYCLWILVQHALCNFIQKVLLLQQYILIMTIRPYQII
jgi:hypothetical protein